MFKIASLRNVFLMALLVMITLGSYNIFLNYPSFEQQLIKNTEEEATRVASYLANTLIHDKSTLTPTDFSSGAFQKRIQSIISNFKLYKLKIFSSSGEIVFSSESKEIGNINNKSYYHDIVAKGQNFTKTGKKGEISMEGIKLQLDVTEIYVPIIKKGQFIGAFEIYYDITERKNRQNSLLVQSSLFALLATLILLFFIILSLRRASQSISELHKTLSDNVILNQQQAAILNSLGDGVYGVDLEGQVDFVNPAACEILGWSSKELLKKNLHSMIHHSYSDGTPYPDRCCPMHGKYHKDEIHNIQNEYFWKKSGEGFPVDLISTPIIIDDNVTGAVVVFRDITERQKVEHELKHAKEQADLANQGKSEFLANMSHEIRTPMNGVLGMLELLQTLKLSDEAITYVKTAMSSADMLLVLINDILDFSKIEARKLFLENTDFNLMNHVEEVVHLLAERGHKKGIDVNCLIENSMPEVVYGDPIRLRQIVTNLLGNAIKFTEKGEVTVKVKCITQDSNNAEILIEVVDTGIGIRKEHQQHLFDAFTQADTTTTRKFGGTGLGLAISKRLISLMEGEIGIKSEPGKGSNFWFIIKLKIGSSHHLHEKVILKGHRVLIVDDNLTNLSIIEHYLASWQIEHESLANGEEVLGVLQAARKDSKPFSLLLLDYQMEGMDGIKVAQLVKSKVEFASLHIIMLSSMGMINTDENPQIDVSISKPIRKKHLYDVLSRMFENEQEKTDDNKVISSAQDENIYADLIILIVEDNRVNQMVAERILHKLGIKVAIANHGGEAVEKAEKNAYDMILMDRHMPVMDGIEATKIIREMEAKWVKKHVPIIALTAANMTGDKEICLEAGMDEFLAKPFSIVQLKQVLNKFML